MEVIKDIVNLDVVKEDYAILYRWRGAGGVRGREGSDSDVVICFVLERIN